MSLVEDFTDKEAEPDSIFGLMQGLKTDLENVEQKPSETEMLRAALKQIAKCEGAYSRDPLTHAGNVIEQSKRIAESALAGTFDPDDF
jgi:hypothetical protein